MSTRHRLYVHTNIKCTNKTWHGFTTNLVTSYDNQRCDSDNHCVHLPENLLCEFAPRSCSAHRARSSSSQYHNMSKYSMAYCHCARKKQICTAQQHLQSKWDKPKGKCPLRSTSQILIPIDNAKKTSTLFPNGIKDTTNWCRQECQNSNRWKVGLNYNPYGQLITRE